MSLHPCLVYFATSGKFSYRIAVIYLPTNSGRGKKDLIIGDGIFSVSFLVHIVLHLDQNVQFSSLNTRVSSS